MASSRRPRWLSQRSVLNVSDVCSSNTAGNSRASCVGKISGWSCPRRRRSMGKIPMGFDVLTIVLLVGGLLGSILRVVTSKDQSTFSRASIVDVITGGLVGILFPAFYTFYHRWASLHPGGAVGGVLAGGWVGFLSRAFSPLEEGWPFPKGGGGVKRVPPVVKGVDRR